MLRSRRGFTLVEILIVVVILGILAAIVIPQFARATTQAQEGALASQLQNLQGQIDIYHARNGTYPPTTSSQTFWDAMLDTANGGAHPYLDGIPVNLAYPGTMAQRQTIGPVTTAGVRGAASTAWVFNTVEHRIYASYYDEASQKVTSTATD